MNAHPSSSEPSQPTPTWTESRILSTYLLTPSPLPTILPLQQFTALFPRHLQSHSQIRTLYRHLQFQRTITIDDVRSNIERESIRGETIRRKLVRDVNSELRAGDGSALPGGVGQKRKRSSPEGDPTDIAIDSSLFTDLNNLPPSTTAANHTLPTLLISMLDAVSTLESEVSASSTESDKILSEMKEIVGGLSDLRYGKFARTSDGAEGIEEEVKEGLERLVEVCDAKTNGPHLTRKTDALPPGYET